MHGIRTVLERLDRFAYQVERLLVFFSLVMMTLLIFSDVIVRTFTRPVGKTAGFLLWFLRLITDVSSTLEADVGSRYGPTLFLVFATLFCVFAAHAGRTMRSRKSAEAAVSLGGSVAIGLLVLTGLALIVKLVVWAFPTGIPGAQKLALGFMVWAGFLGGSLATRSRRHIAIDAIKKKLDPKALPWFSLFGGVASAAFAALLAGLAMYKATGQITEWHESGGRLHMFESLPIPEWLVTLALPVAFSLIALRFLVHGVGDLLYGPSLESDTDAHGVNLEQLARDAQATSASEAAKTDAGPRLYGVEHRGHTGRAVKMGGAQ